ncbi:TPA: hypothetical protein ONE11_001198 [Enterobacter hormaechei subsp. steigerwaltii]|nr:hypothetical protein [Enterobacter hormaechei]ELC6559484.1 hypothetical protein [Enterobacter hormaechei]HCR2217645.1 hypothetical protein [Enterobacter hormaechei subsp. steigerwaltii]
MIYQYCREAKERISKLGQMEIVDFIGEISPASRRKAFSYLPKVPGFRVGHPTEIKEKQKRLIGYMLQTNASPEEKYAWKSFSLFWKIWAEEHIGKPFNICDDLEVKDNSGSNFIRELAKTFPNVAKEDVERLFIFSRFAEDPGVVGAFEIFRPAAILARDNVVDALPVRLEELEERVEIIEIDFEINDNKIKNLESEIYSLTQNFETHLNDFENKFIKNNELKSLFNFEVERYDVIEKSIEELRLFNKNNEILTSSIQDKFKSNVLAIDEISGHVKKINDIAKEITELKKSLTILFERDEVSNNLNNESEYKKLSERIDRLEVSQSQSGTVSMNSQPRKFQEIFHNDNYECLSSHEDVFNLISSNLQAAGLTKSSAETVARLALATFISGQIIQFSGSLADIIADAIATAIGAPYYHVWRVPVGIISDTDSFDFVESIGESSRCLVLKGANLSAFEIYGTAIRDMVVQRQIYSTNYDHLALIATWKQGPAAFPNGGMLAELGPVIDTDTLKMRGLSSNLPKLKPGYLVKHKWANIDGLKVDSDSEYIDELRELLDETGFDGGNLWKRMIHVFYTSLIRIPNGNYFYDLYSVLSFYTLTWARIIGGPVEKIENIATRELKNHSEKISA